MVSERLRPVGTSDGKSRGYMVVPDFSMISDEEYAVSVLAQDDHARAFEHWAVSAEDVDDL